MKINSTFELSMTLGTDHFQEVFARAYNKVNLKELEDGYLDPSMMDKGLTVIYRDSQYKKKVRLLVNTCFVVDDPDDADKLTRKLNKKIIEYFNHRFQMEDFTISGMNLVADIDVGNRKNVSDYLRVIQKVGKVKGFSPIDYEFLDGVDSFCLSGNSNSTDFLLYDLGAAVMSQRRNTDTGRKTLKSVSQQVGSILRAEVHLTKPKAIRDYTEADNVSSQIVEMLENRQNIFLDTFTRVVPYGDFHKKDAAMEIIRSEVRDHIIRRRMLRLLALIPEKKSLHLAQKAMQCRDVEKVMEAFSKINLSPVTISKRHDIKQLASIYNYL